MATDVDIRLMRLEELLAKLDYDVNVRVINSVSAYSGAMHEIKNMVRILTDRVTELEDILDGDPPSK